MLPASREFLQPLTGSSLATLIVFLPLGFLSGVTGELGATISDYRTWFELQYCDNYKLLPGDYPMDRVVAGEASTEVVVNSPEPMMAGNGCIGSAA